MEPYVGLVGMSAIQSTAMTTWLSGLGFEARTIGYRDLEQHGRGLPMAIVVGDTGKVNHAVLRRLPEIPTVVLLNGAAVSSFPRAAVINDSPDAPVRLLTALSSVLDATRDEGVVPLTVREREVLATYVRGATVSETAAVHFLSPTTIRTHYRRVSRRYNDVGRPVANKAQLLMRMVEDGWIELDS